MAQIKRLEPFRPRPGDDLPITSMVYRDLPEQWKLKNLKPKEDKPLTIAHWEEMVTVADHFFTDFEIVGVTYRSWFNQVQTAYYLHADVLENYLAVYEDDINLPLQSREIIRTYEGQSNDEYSRDVTNSGNGSSTTTGTVKDVGNTKGSGTFNEETTGTNKGTVTDDGTNTTTGTTTTNGTSHQTESTTETALAFDSNNTEPSKRTDRSLDGTDSNTVENTATVKNDNTQTTDSSTSSKTEQSFNNNEDTTNTRTDNTTVTSTNGFDESENSSNRNQNSHTEKEFWSDVGVAPNYTLMNGYLDNARTYNMEFIRYLRPFFTLREVMTW